MKKYLMQSLEIISPSSEDDENDNQPATVERVLIAVEPQSPESQEAKQENLEGSDDDLGVRRFDDIEPKPDSAGAFLGSALRSGAGGQGAARNTGRKFGEKYQPSDADGENTLRHLMSISRQAVLVSRTSNLVGVLQMNQEEKHRLSKLESMNGSDMRKFQIIMLTVFLFFLIYTATITGLSINSWEGFCSFEMGCPYTSFKAAEWFNFVCIGVICLSDVVFAVAYIRQLFLYKRKKRDRKLRPDSFWCLALLFPCAILWNNPLFNLDRVSFTKGIISSTAASGLSIVRFFTSASTTTMYAIYVQFKIGSVQRADALDDPYPLNWYLWRIIPNIAIFAAQFCVALFLRLDISPQMFVSIFTLLRRDYPTKVDIAIGCLGALNFLGVAVFMFLYKLSTRRIQTVGYHRVRQKHLQAYFLWRNTFLMLSATALVTIVCSALFPETIVFLFRVNGEYVEDYIMNVPYFARAGIKLLFTAYFFAEAISVLPGSYKPSWLEQQVLKAMQITDVTAQDGPLVESETDADNRDESSLPIIWDTPADRNASRKKSYLTKLVMRENVTCFDLSWLIYLDDAAIELVAKTQFGSHGLHLDGVWRIPEKDLTFMVVHTRNSIFVCFRGTVTLANWKVNMNLKQRPHEPMKDPEWLEKMWRRPRLGAKVPKVHAGFQEAYRSLRGEVIEAVYKVKSEFEKEASVLSNPRILCCGHSLGGALATLCAFDMRLELGLSEFEVSAYTYGSPFVGNRPFARRYAAAVPHTFRVVNRFDGITNMPKSLIDHFEHVPRAVLIDDTGNLIVDPVFSDVQFFHGNGALAHLMGSYRDHFQKFIDRTGSGWEPKWLDFEVVGEEALERAENKQTESATVQNDVGLGRFQSQIFVNPLGKIGNAALTQGAEEPNPNPGNNAPLKRGATRTVARLEDDSVFSTRRTDLDVSGSEAYQSSVPKVSDSEADEMV